MRLSDPPSRRAVWLGRALALLLGLALAVVAERNSARFAVFVTPDRRQMDDADWSAPRAKLPDLNPADLDRERPTRMILDLLAQGAIPALDLLEPFRAADEPLFFEIDGHFNAAGHALTAELLATWLHDEAMIP
jgi:lysophospholipase L1-like esterase